MTMTIKLGVIMDDIRTIKVHHDTTFALLLEASRRHIQIYYMQPHDLFTKEGKVFANMQIIQVQDDPQNHFQTIKQVTEELTTLSVILMRKDPPVDTTYIYVTQLLDLVEKAGVKVVNKPQALRDFNEKLFINYFPECCAPTLVASDKQCLRDFWQSHGDIICKPLHGLGGESIFRVKEKDQNINVIIETLTKHGRQFMMMQKFIPEISQGDKRILLIHGKPVPYALARFAKAGETRANMAAGGSGKGVALTERDYWICAQLKPVLQKHGLALVGIDVIGDYLTEINITSPTCVRELENEFQLNICAPFFDELDL